MNLKKWFFVVLCSLVSCQLLVCMDDAILTQFKESIKEKPGTHVRSLNLSGISTELLKTYLDRIKHAQKVRPEQGTKQPFRRLAWKIIQALQTRGIDPASLGYQPPTVRCHGGTCQRHEERMKGVWHCDLQRKCQWRKNQGQWHCRKGTCRWKGRQGGGGRQRGKHCRGGQCKR